MVTPDNPSPPDVTVPNMLKVETAEALKLTAVLFAPLKVCELLAGLKAKPVLLGVIVKLPFSRPLKM